MFSAPAALAVALAAAVWLYWQAPDPTTPAAPSKQTHAALVPGGAEEGHKRDLHRLHHEPSEAYCSLPPPLVCAHGGDGSSGAPPNTLEAFQAALDAGVPCAEVDVAATRDGQLVVLHPRDLAQLLHQAGDGPAQHGSNCAAEGEAVAERAAAIGSAAAERGARGGSCDAQHPQHPQHPQLHRPPQVGHFTWSQLAALRWPGGQRVAAAEDVLRLLVPATAHITLDVKMDSGPVSLATDQLACAPLVALLGCMTR